MIGFAHRGGTLHAEGVPLSRIADAVSTPVYVYSGGLLDEAYRALDGAFAGTPHLICYSVKASSNLALLRRFVRLGAGFDVVSRGELLRVRRAGGSAQRTVFAGVGKTRDEMAEALSAGLLLFNVESAEELLVLDAVAREQGRAAPFALRVNPHVDAGTHRYISTALRTSKFGITLEDAKALYAKSRRMRGLEALGVDCHIGSQVIDLSPIRSAATKVAEFYRALRAQGFPLRYLDVGGGLGIPYSGERTPKPAAYGAAIRRATADTGATLLLEPGRSLVGNAAVLLTRVLYRKPGRHKTFVVVDAGMNDLIRPALYEAHHGVVTVKTRGGRLQNVDVVGPVCESSDVLARERRLVLPELGDLLAIQSAGAYGMSMASTYNSRPRAAEVLVDGKRFRVIRQRERISDLWRGEAVT